MKNLLFTTLVLLTGMHCLAQKKTKTVYKVKFELSPEVKKKGKHSLIGLGSDGQYTYTLTTKGAIVSGIPMGFKFVLNKFDADMNKVLSESIPRKTDHYKVSAYTSPRIFMHGKKIYQIAWGSDKKSGQRNFYLVEFTTQSLRRRNELQIASFALKDRVRNEIHTLIDPANEKEFGVLVQSQKEKGRSHASIQLIEEGLEETFRSELDFEAEIKDVRISDWVVRDQYVAFTCQVGVPDEPTTKTYFYLLDRSTGEVYQIEMLLHELPNAISDFKYVLHEDGQLFVSGFYRSDAEKADDAGGAFTQVYSVRENELISESHRPFDFEFLTENMSDRQKEKAEKRSEKGKDVDAYDFLVREVIANEDGSSILVAERFRIYETSYTDSKGNRQTVNHYVHSDLITMRTGAEGEIEWITRFKKYDNSTNSLHGQFLFRNEGEYFYIIYVEDTDELKMVRISTEDGSASSKVVFSANDIEKYWIALSTSVQQNAYTYVSQLYRTKRIRTLTIKFKE